MAVNANAVADAIPKTYGVLSDFVQIRSGGPIKNINGGSLIHPVISSDPNDQSKYFDSNAPSRTLIIRKDLSHDPAKTRNVEFIDREFALLWIKSDCMYLSATHSEGFNEKYPLKFICLYLLHNKERLIDPLYRENGKIFVSKVKDIAIPDVSAETMNKIVNADDIIKYAINRVKNNLADQRGILSAMKSYHALTEQEHDEKLATITEYSEYITKKSNDSLLALFSDENIFAKDAERN